jgi:hypothetical protein
MSKSDKLSLLAIDPPGPFSSFILALARRRQRLGG